jgi:hypothetical protein
MKDVEVGKREIKISHQISVRKLTGRRYVGRPKEEWKLILKVIFKKLEPG